MCDTNPNIDLLSQLLVVYKAKANEVKAGRLDSRQIIGLLPQRKTEWTIQLRLNSFGYFSASFSCGLSSSLAVLRKRG
jgi:hypothetical protein